MNLNDEASSNTLIIDYPSPKIKKTTIKPTIILHDQKSH